MHHLNRSSPMAKQYVNLDALIHREDFEEEEDPKN